MTELPFRVLKPAVVAGLLLAGIAGALAGATSAAAQPRDQGGPPDPPATRLESLQRDTSGFFGQLFGGSDRSANENAVQKVQASPSDLVLRLDRMENQIRQLTGQLEQLQYRNQQLESLLRQMQGGAAAPAATSMRPPAGQSISPPPAEQSLPRRSEAFDPAAENVGGGPRPQRRSDVFEPTESPNAPGAPRVLGSLPSGPTIVTGDGNNSAPPIGAPGGRGAGAPLDLSTMSDRAANDPGLSRGPSTAMTGGLPPPPPRNPSATGSPQLQAALPATSSPKDEYDLAYGYLLRKDYALAEESFRAFLQKHPSDRLTPDASYWLGETLFQRQRYRDAAESFLNVSTKFEKSGKAPDALLRLGQSLAALKEKEAACATFVEVGRKYPRASPGVKQGVEREQKRAGC